MPPIGQDFLHPLGDASADVQDWQEGLSREGCQTHKVFFFTLGLKLSPSTHSKDTGAAVERTAFFYTGIQPQMGIWLGNFFSLLTFPLSGDT